MLSHRSLYSKLHESEARDGVSTDRREVLYRARETFYFYSSRFLCFFFFACATVIGPGFEVKRQKRLWRRNVIMSEP